MLSRIIISLAMASALFTAPVGLASRSCILSSAPAQQGCKSACCANKACCATSAEHKASPTQPLAKADSNQQLKAIGFVTALFFSSCEARSEQFRLHATESSAISPPRLALLCTLLI
jgi:hypothetical protein